MHFPAPPSFHDPLLYPPTTTASSTTAATTATAPAPSVPISGPSASPTLLAPIAPPAAVLSQPREQYQPSRSGIPLPPPPPPPQQQQQTSQYFAYNMNGMNGAPGPGIVNLMPNQAGHQAELNYIYGMVEELSRQLAENKQALERVVTGVGRVRNRARTHAMGNEELIASAGDDVKDKEPNMDMIISALSEAIDKAKYSRDANAALLGQYATALSSMLKQFHDYKARHVADVAAWHRSYRAQLAEARGENSRLREQIWEMQARAGRANEVLREFRARFDDDDEESDPSDDEKDKEKKDKGDDAKEAENATAEKKEKDKTEDDDGDMDDAAKEAAAAKAATKASKAAARRRHDARVRAKAMRQELRFWKRMAMPDIPDDDPCWSDDDDLIDSAEKKRQLELEKKNAEQQLLAAAAAQAASDAEGNSSGEDSDGPMPGPLPQLAMTPQILGGVPMQREDSGTMGMPVPPPRPPSAASTGSSGQ